MSRETPPGTVRPVGGGQLYRDLAQAGRDYRVRVRSVEADGRAVCTVEHDLGGIGGRHTGGTTRILTENLTDPTRYELLFTVEQLAAPKADERFELLLTAMASVHRPGAEPHDYARAAYDVLGLAGTTTGGGQP
jgi:hypothetical protein